MSMQLTTVVLTDPNAIIMRNHDTGVTYTAGVLWESCMHMNREIEDSKREFEFLRYKYIASMGINIALMFLATWATQ